MAANKRVGEPAYKGGPPVSAFNPKVCFALLDLICYAKDHPEKFEGCTCNILVPMDRLRRLQASYT